jgi:hypothetical protein
MSPTDILHLQSHFTAETCRGNIYRRQTPQMQPSVMALLQLVPALS